MAGSFYGLSFIDSSNEASKTDFNIGDLTAISLAGALTQMGALRTAIEGVVLGTVSVSRWGDSDILSSTRPTDPLCQRGVKWSVLMEDSVTHTKFTNKIPTADLSLLPLVGGVRSEDLDLTAGAGLALKTAIDALAKSPAGNAASVLRIYYSD
jgi:hypothetical protein